MKRSPANIVIEAFGGVRSLARQIGCSKSSVSRWQTPVEDGGTGGRVPGPRHVAILALAKKKGVDLTAEQLIHGDKR